MSSKHTVQLKIGDRVYESPGSSCSHKFHRHRSGITVRIPSGIIWVKATKRNPGVDEVYIDTRDTQLDVEYQLGRKINEK